MDITVRGFNEGGMEKWFDIAREWIVRGFADLTGKDIQTKIFGIIRRPSWCGNLKDADVVESALLWIEFRIFPVGVEGDGADAVRIAGVAGIHGAADGFLAAPVGADGAIS